MNAESPAAAVAGVVAALDGLGVPWFLTGSVAASLHGVPRATNVADIVARLPVESAEAFVQHLGEGYYADAGMVRRAFARRSSCNVIWLASMMKIDLMPPRFAIDEGAFARCRSMLLDDGIGGSVPVRVASPEDVILAKLIWFREGGRQSQRQLGDVRGIIAAQPALDRPYLADGAIRCGVEAELATVLPPG